MADNFFTGIIYHFHSSGGDYIGQASSMDLDRVIQHISNSYGIKDPFLSYGFGQIESNEELRNDINQRGAMNFVITYSDVSTFSNAIKESPWVATNKKDFAENLMIYNAVLNKVNLYNKQVGGQKRSKVRVDYLKNKIKSLGLDENTQKILIKDIHSINASWKRNDNIDISNFNTFLDPFPLYFNQALDKNKISILYSIGDISTLLVNTIKEKKFNTITSKTKEVEIKIDAKTVEDKLKAPLIEKIVKNIENEYVFKDETDKVDEISFIVKLNKNNSITLKTANINLPKLDYQHNIITPDWAKKIPWIWKDAQGIIRQHYYTLLQYWVSKEYTAGQLRNEGIIKTGSFFDTHLEKNLQLVRNETRFVFDDFDNRRNLFRSASQEYYSSDKEGKKEKSREFYQNRAAYFKLKFETQQKAFKASSSNNKYRIYY